MKRAISINVILDTETAYITDYDIVDNGDRTEFVLDGVDDPISINEMLESIGNELAYKIQR